MARNDTKNRTIELCAIEFATAREAIQYADPDVPEKAIRLDGQNLVVSQSDADRLSAAGIEFAYLCDHKMPDGTHRIMTVPAN